jgi:dolichol-phosphate mannosyltransferase
MVWEMSCEGYEFQVEAIWLAKEREMDIEEIPITFTERYHGESKLNSLSEIRNLLTFILKQKYGSR